MKLDRFINRPVLSTVISVLIVILGIIGLATLPVTQYPDIAPPTVQVRATYTGANSTAVLNSVIAPLEDQINGVENMMYIQSSASNNGAADINVYFNQGTDPDMAAVNVQNRVSMAQGLLPAEVTKVGVTTQKRQNSMLMVFSLYDETDSYNIEFIENYANINLIPEIKRVKGVGDANVLGQDYSMRIWLKPDVMAQYKLVPTDVSAALAEQNIEAAPGQFGERGNQTFQYTIRYKGRLQQTNEFEDIVIKALPDGNVLRLGDVADIELGRLAYTFNNTVNGHKAVSCIVYQMAGTNATETISNLEEVLAKAQESLPTGLNINIAQNANDFLFASIHEVIKTLIEAFILVFIVVYIFLQDMRSTLIPAIAIPVALVATFFVLKLIGFSVNLLTLSAMVLAIAIVVDDAIVVVEGVHAKLDQGYKSSREASIDAMSELGGAIVSITLVMMSVFIPVSFMGGTAGTFYRQFVDKGMCADYGIHRSYNDKGQPNLHIHILLTLRPLNEDGTWGAKSRKEYVLDADGNRIPNASGKGYKSRKVNVIDWNEKGKAKEWRNAIAEVINATNEKAGIAERVDPRSYKDRGIPLIPTIHLGERASALERKGIWTERGNINRAIEKYNAMIMKIYGFISELKEELKKGVFKFAFERKSRTENIAKDKNESAE